MTLDEVIREARRLDDAATFADRGSIPWEEFADTNARVDAFYAEHGPRLLAVAEAAVEMRRIGGCVLLPGGNDGCPCSICEATRAFDAAVRGDRLPQPDGKEGEE